MDWQSFVIAATSGIFGTFAAAIFAAYHSHKDSRLTRAVLLELAEARKQIGTVEFKLNHTLEAMVAAEKAASLAAGVVAGRQAAEAEQAIRDKAYAEGVQAAPAAAGGGELARKL